MRESIHILHQSQFYNIPSSHLSRLLVYVTFIYSLDLLEACESGFVLEELDESGRGLRKDLSSVPY
jgi:hypothetical protein